MSAPQVALYARVSSEHQATACTIASQVAALRERIAADGLTLGATLTFVDDGFSGATLVRPALERLLDAAATGGIDRLYVLAPDRLARRYAYQVLLIEELQRAGVDLVFLARARGTTPEDELLLQVQGVVAEYERAKILERGRRGRRQGALVGAVAVIGHAPYGYRYIPKALGGGQAQYEVVPEEAHVVRQVFAWVGRERLSMGEVARRLNAAGVPRRTSTAPWDRSLIYSLCTNPAYKGTAAFGKTRVGPLRPQLRPQRGHPAQPRRPSSVYHVPSDEWISVPVPPLVAAELFDAVQEQLAHNRRHAKLEQRCTQFLAQGLTVCARCGYAYCGARSGARSKGDPARRYGYYRCIGTQHASPWEGARCDNPAIRGDLLDEAVWAEVVRLLEDPERLRAEYERRVREPEDATAPQDAAALDGQARKLRQGLARLIDAYAEGLLDKEEVEPRIRRLKDRIAHVEAQARAVAVAAAEQADLRLVIGHLAEFAAAVTERLPQLEWEMRRAILRVLVKRIEIDYTAIRVVFRVGPEPLTLHPDGHISQDRERCYGTVIVDLERHRPAALLPARDADLVAAWFRAQPHLEIISRDRSDTFANAATRGAPQATQVADRFHLSRNLGEALEAFLLHKRTVLKETAAAIADVLAPIVVPLPAESMYPGKRKTPQPQLWKQRAEEKSLRQHARRVAAYDAVHALRANGADLADVARLVGISRRTVYRYLDMDSPPERKRSVRRTRPERAVYEAYLVRRWNEGCHNGRRLWRELRALGHTCGEATVARFVAQLRRGQPRRRPASTAGGVVTSVQGPTAHHVALLMLRRPAQRTSEQRAYLEELCRRDPAVAAAAALVDDFAQMLRERQGERLDAWIAAAMESGIVELRRFARGLEADYAAVRAGLTLPFSNGQVEGQITRLKLVRRSMYGRGKFDLLERRVLAA